MLSDEDKADVIANKATYSLDDIEAKLAVIAVRKKVSFKREESLETELDSEGNPVTTFSLDELSETVPAHVQALRSAKQTD
jgi:hypothetical protein